MSTLAEIAPKAEALILDYEGCALRPEWPEGDSGITIGYGYDLGYYTEDEFITHWAAFFGQTQFDKLKGVLGITGQRAKARLPGVAFIQVKEENARFVFDTYCMPEEMERTKAVFPGADLLPGEAFGALVSLVYNRGNELKGDTRTEMAAIVPLVAAKDLKGIVTQILYMRRLWPDHHYSDRDLYDRRTDEAKLITDCIG